MPWAPRLLDYPRYLVAADVTGGARCAAAGVHRRAVPCDQPALVRENCGCFRAATAIAPGTFVFTTDGAFAGLGVSHDGHAAIVPAALLFSAVERLQEQPGEAGDLGIAIQPLSRRRLRRRLARAAGVVDRARSIRLDAAAGRLVANRSDRSDRRGRHAHARSLARARGARERRRDADAARSRRRRRARRSRSRPLASTPACRAGRRSHRSD